MIRTGLGYDMHRLKRGRHFLLAGIQIPFHKGEDGHSDGDVLAHAVCDALLGAASLGDIGELFPSSDSRFKDADSMMMMREVHSLVKEAGWKLVNLDCVIICEKPKVLPFRREICVSLANALNVPSENVFVKGKTAERLGDTGKGRAIEAFALCLLEKS